MESGHKITPDTLKEKKKEIIQAECHGLLEFIEPAWTLDVVAGHAKAKKMLRDASSMLKKGRIEVMPMGYLVSGPVGTGKTFLVTCFAGEIGIPCVKFLNFRSQWQGVTESNLEKIFNLPGLGKFFVISALQRDYTVVMGMIVVYAGLVLFLNLLGDLMLAVVDPRVRLS
jgi:hypothetical protein